jgi:hypothetical protein
MQESTNRRIAVQADLGIMQDNLSKITNKKDWCVVQVAEYLF